MTPGRVSKCLIATTVAVAVLTQGTAVATFNSIQTATHSITAHTLVTPTLSCTASGTGLLGATVHLTWPAASDSTTSDPYGSGFLTDGYEIDSGTINGGPYPTVVATATRTATSYNDTAPANGTSYYVIRSTKLLWRSAKSNQVTSSVQALSASCS
jgi:hypothetical protein